MSNRIFDAYRRLRHSYGFGVHSPFAYSIVQRVLNPGRNYRWYGYDDIELAAPLEHPARIRRQARLLLRLAATCHIHSAYIPAETPPAFYTALKAANSNMHISHKSGDIEKCELVCCDGSGSDIEHLCKLAHHPHKILAIRNAPSGWADMLFDNLEEGVMLHGKSNIIIICRRNMQKLAYTVNI